MSTVVFATIGNKLVEHSVHIVAPTGVFQGSWTWNKVLTMVQQTSQLELEQFLVLLEEVGAGTQLLDADNQGLRSDTDFWHRNSKCLQ